jgi:hypothetical protein
MLGKISQGDPSRSIRYCATIKVVEQKVEHLFAAFFAKILWVAPQAQALE